MSARRAGQRGGGGVLAHAAQAPLPLLRRDLLLEVRRARHHAVDQQGQEAVPRLQGVRARVQGELLRGRAPARQHAERAAGVRRARRGVPWRQAQGVGCLAAELGEGPAGVSVQGLRRACGPRRHPAVAAALPQRRDVRPETGPAHTAREDRRAPAAVRAGVPGGR